MDFDPTAQMVGAARKMTALNVRLVGVRVSDDGFEVWRFEYEGTIR